VDNIQAKYVTGTFTVANLFDIVLQILSVSNEFYRRYNKSILATWDSHKTEFHKVV